MKYLILLLVSLTFGNNHHYKIIGEVSSRDSAVVSVISSYMGTGLFLKGNSVTALGANGRLHTLRMTHLGLTKIHPILLELDALQYLDLKYNNLDSLPRGFKSLVSLKVVYLEHNKFTSFPEDIVNAPKLIDIVLSNNLIDTLSSKVYSIEGRNGPGNFTSVNLDSNLLETFPPEPAGRNVMGIDLRVKLQYNRICYVDSSLDYLLERIAYGWKGTQDCSGTQAEVTLSQATEIGVYPNPFSSFLNITVSQEYAFIVYNIAGKIVYRTQGQQSFYWKPKNLSEGFYILSVISNQQSFNRKVLYRR